MPSCCFLSCTIMFYRILHCWHSASSRIETRKPTAQSFTFGSMFEEEILVHGQKTFRLPIVLKTRDVFVKWQCTSCSYCYYYSLYLGRVNLIISDKLNVHNFGQLASRYQTLSGWERTKSLSNLRYVVEMSLLRSSHMLIIETNIWFHHAKFTVTTHPIRMEKCQSIIKYEVWYYKCENLIKMCKENYMLFFR